MNTILSPRLLLFFFLGLALVGCKEDEDDDPNGPTYQVPTTYTFANVDYSGQTTRLNMLKELTTLMKTGNTPNTVVEAQALKNMFANANAPFSDPALNTSGKQLKDKTFINMQATFENYMDQLAAASTSTQTGSNGQAGVVTSTSDATKKYLMDANGIEHIQLIEKGLMGACFFYQIANVYTTDDRIGPAVPKADAQHHWDEAFGYFGAPIDYPTNSTGVYLLSKYALDRNALLGTGTAIMNAYLKGRAAIDNDDRPALDAAVDELLAGYEKMLAGTAIKYFNDAVESFADDAVRNHVLSEAIAFVRAIGYSPQAGLTAAQINDVLANINETANLYEVTQAQITAARDLLASLTGLESVKTQL